MTKQICSFFVLLLLATTQSLAQPGSCSLLFDSSRICQTEYVTEDFVFVGHVSALDDVTTKLENNQLWKIFVIEVIPIKGKLPKMTKLFLNQTFCKGSVEIGKKYIFTAHKLNILGTDELVSSKWSTNIADSSKSQFAELIKKIRSVTKNKKQPRVIGQVIQYNLDPLGRYDFQGESLISKLGYNPAFASPSRNTSVIAKNKDGKVFGTVTDENGKFEFKNLESGNYEISPVLSQNIILNKFQYFTSSFESGFLSIATEKRFFNVVNKICGEDIRFNIRISGNALEVIKK